MMARFLLVAVALLLAGEAGAQSREPPKQEAAERDVRDRDHNQNGARNNGGAALAESNQAPAASDQQNTENKVPRPFWERVTADPALALLTIGLLIAAFWQVHISRETAKRELRAYMSIKAAGATRKELRVQTSVYLINAGQTPARHVIMGAKIILIDVNRMSETPPFEFATLQPSGGVVWGPGLELPPLDAERLLEPDEFNAVAREKRAFAVLVGQVRYVDIFDEPRETNFRYVIDLLTNDLTPHESGGNDAN